MGFFGFPPPTYCKPKETISRSKHSIFEWVCTLERPTVPRNLNGFFGDLGLRHLSEYPVFFFEKQTFCMNLTAYPPENYMPYRKGTFEWMIFLFPWWEYVSLLEGNFDATWFKLILALMLLMIAACNLHWRYCFKEVILDQLIWMI